MMMMMVTVIVVIVIRHISLFGRLLQEAYSGELSYSGSLFSVSSLIREAYSGEVSYLGSLFGVIRAYSGSYSGLFGELFRQNLGVLRAKSWSSGAYSGTDLFSGAHSSVVCCLSGRQAGRQVALEGATLF